LASSLPGTAWSKKSASSAAFGALAGAAALGAAIDRTKAAHATMIGSWTVRLTVYS
jgi:hypothetical protein